MKTKSFTLIELMAVIFIIAILAGIMVYGVSDWKEDAYLKKTMAYSQEVKNKLGSSLLAEWKMEEGSGAFIYDSGRLGLTGKNVPANAWRAKNCAIGNSCLYINGSNVLWDSFDMGFKTICFWIKHDSGNSYNILEKGGFKISVKNGIINFNAGVEIPLSGASINDSKWHFVCGSIDDVFYGIFDGEIKASHPVSITEFGNSSAMSLGANNNEFYIDDIALFKDPIKPGQISQ